MILSDRDILAAIRAKRITIKPFHAESVQPASVDLHLMDEFLAFEHSNHSVIDVKKGVGHYTRKFKVKKGQAFVIHPGEFVLGSTQEWVKLPNDLAARLEGKSSLGRLGIIIHATAGYVDPGFEGHLTLEINNVGKIPVTLYPGMRIAQISYLKMSSPVLHPYGSDKLRSKYKGQKGPTESKILKGKWF